MGTTGISDYVIRGWVCTTPGCGWKDESDGITGPMMHLAQNPDHDVGVAYHHSPTGFEWGYGGSGPHATAWAILEDLAGPEIANRFYNQFVRDVVSRLNRGTTHGHEWALGEEQIRDWIAQQFREAVTPGYPARWWPPRDDPDYEEVG